MNKFKVIYQIFIGICIVEDILAASSSMGCGGSGSEALFEDGNVYDLSPLINTNGYVFILFFYFFIFFKFFIFVGAME